MAEIFGLLVNAMDDYSQAEPMSTGLVDALQASKEYCNIVATS